jgi:Protein of unknown function (DUF429)
MIGFGLDLAGYTSTKTSLAVIESAGKEANVFLLRNSAFARKRDTSSPRREAVFEEERDLDLCIGLGPLAVDVPIDLQGLPFPSDPVEIWELTKRPIDKKLRALAPFANRIGAPVVRFAAIRNQKSFSGELGKNLFETYPTEIWKRLGLRAGAYKVRDKKKAKTRSSACVGLCRYLHVEPALRNDDDIDALICAVTAVAPEHHLCAAGELEVNRVPLGSRILKMNPFERIRVEEAEFCEWVNNQKKKT